MIKPGDRVVARRASFEGRVLGQHGRIEDATFHSVSLPEDLNVRIHAVMSQETGEVRFFVTDGIEPVAD